jgi:hypothetical protein
LLAEYGERYGVNQLFRDIEYVQALAIAVDGDGECDCIDTRVVAFIYLARTPLVY